MYWHDFIFSNQSKHRIRRHATGWLLWWCFIILTIFYTYDTTADIRRNPPFFHHQPGLNELGYFSYIFLVLVKAFLLLLAHMLFCYGIIYIIVPNFQLKKNYWLLATGLLLACMLMLPLSNFLYTRIYPLIDKGFGLHVAVRDKFIVWRSVDAGLINSVKLTLVALAITLLKGWWVKQKEKEHLEKEKIRADLQLLKAQIHPVFLFNTLNNIITHAEAASPKAPEMLIKLSDVLSYMLYECDAPKVKLEKEIGMIKDYMTLEKIRQGERLDMTFQINGNPDGQFISPLLLLPFIDHSFSYCNNQLLEQAWVNLDITIDENFLSMKLINGVPADLSSEGEHDKQSLDNIKKRLELLYAGRYELKINAEHELLIVHLNLKLEDSVPGERNHQGQPKLHLHYAGI